MKKTVIFGGTFNPVHIGHEVMMKAVSELDCTKELIIMPDNIPPHKEVGGDFAAAEHRLNMCRLASEGMRRATVSEHELKKPGKSYTIDTLTELKAMYPQKSLAIVIGGDMLVCFDRVWHRYEDILKLASLIAFRRTEEDRVFDEKVEHLKSMGADITVLNVRVPEVSSTEVRRRIRVGEDCTGLLNPKICEYILSNKLYKDFGGKDGF